VGSSDSGGGAGTNWIISAGTIIYGENIIQPAYIAVGQDNWNPTGLSTADTIYITSTAAAALRGIVAPAQAGRVLKLYNAGAFSINLGNEIATSTAANRFKTANAVVTVLTPQDSAFLTYSSILSRWIVSRTL
jgi:hypothetical protein